MFNISRDFAPPLRMIEPCFLIGSAFYALGVLFLLFLDPTSGHVDLITVGWAHWFLLGFVMMIIFGAMAQLIPVVVEVGHFSVDLYYLIWPSLLVGTLIMVAGFWWVPDVLAYGGLLVLVAMVTFLFETFLTLKKAERITLTVKSVLWANIFLTVAIVIGFLMALAIGEGVVLDVSKWLGAHAMLVLGGFVTLTIMGLSLILLPMFGLSHGFDEKPIERAFGLMVGAVIAYVVGTLFGMDWVRWISLVVSFVSVGFYGYMIWIIYQTRARKAHDIYAKTMYVGYGSLGVALVLGIVTLFSSNEQVLLSASWFLMLGFFSYLINGHLYKIVPFLVWFERYSPLVGKQKVPMLGDMLPDRRANWQFWFTTAGLVIGGAGLLFGSEGLFHGGVTLMVVGAGFMFSSVRFMLAFGKELDNAA
jgi:uncharacterized protein YcfJ